MLRKLRQERIRLENIKNELDKELKILPKDKLRVSSSNGCPQYFINGVYSSKKNIQEIKLIAKHEYYSVLSRKIEEYINNINKLICLYESTPLDAIFQNLCKGKQNLIENSIYETSEQIIKRFMSSSENLGNPKYETEGNMITMKGESVRSKSEKIIADELYRRNIPYKYEAPITLINKNYPMTIYPDFSVLNVRKKKVIYLEHLGMMSNGRYIENTLFKLNMYEANGILIGCDLILTHETNDAPLNVKIINKYIDEFLI